MLRYKVQRHGQNTLAPVTSVRTPICKSALPPPFRPIQGYLGYSALILALSQAWLVDL